MIPFSARSATRLRDLLPQRRLRVIALISSFNEGDVIGQVIGDLIGNGCEVYLLDNHSTDNTVEVASQWLGRGLIEIEAFPPGPPADLEKQYLWREILMRKSQLAVQLGADWIIHADADELRESPWPDMSLADAFGVVDSLGFNAVNFALFNFRPVDDSFRPGDDLRQCFQFYEPGEWVNALQIKAWKNTGVEVDLASSGGHNVAFAERQVFPIPFILRHYPIRGSEHGRRKVLNERLPRYTRQERAAGWHNHYDAMASEGHSFLWQAQSLTRFDPGNERAELLARAFDAMLLTGSAARTGFSPASDPAWLLAHVGNRLGVPVSQELLGQALEELKELLQIFQRDRCADNCPMPRHYEIMRVIAQVESARADLTGDFRLSFMWNAIERKLAAERPLPQRAALAPLTPPVADDAEDDATIFLRNTRAMIEAGDLDAAYQLLLSQQEALLEHPQYLFQLGYIGLLSGMLDDANNIFTEAIRHCPDVLKQVIEAYQGRLQATPRLALATRSLPSPPPDDPVALAQWQIAREQYEEAFATLTQALNERPEDPEIIFQMGVLAQVCDMHADATELFYQSAQRAPEMTEKIFDYYRQLLAGPSLEELLTLS